MNVKSLDGKEMIMDVRPNKFPLKTREACKSNFQYECGQLLKSVFPFDPILEEVPIPGHRITLDFFIPTRKWAFEIHGRQHTQYVSHFHGSPKGFKQSQERDQKKSKWCQINGITLYVIYSIEEMRNILGIPNE